MAVEDRVRFGDLDVPKRITRSKTRLHSDMERPHVARVLSATGWHRGEACQILGVSRPRLRRMIREYDLTPPAGIDHEPNGGQ